MTFILIPKYTTGEEPIRQHTAIQRAMELGSDEWYVGPHPRETSMLEIALMEEDPKAFRAEDRGGVWFVFLDSPNDS